MGTSGAHGRQTVLIFTHRPTFGTATGTVTPVGGCHRARLRSPRDLVERRRATGDAGLVSDETDDSGQLDLLAGISPPVRAPKGEPLTSRSRWGTLERHDPVTAKGLRGEHVFWAHVTNPATGDEWVSVYGGTKNGVRQFRSVEADGVRPKKVKAVRPRQEPMAPPTQTSLDLPD